MIGAIGDQRPDDFQLSSWCQNRVHFSEDEMEIGDRQQVSLTIGKPSGVCEGFGILGNADRDNCCNVN